MLALEHFLKIRHEQAHFISFVVFSDRSVLRKQGRENAFWVILDYSDIVVHIFLTDQRLFYRLEDLWADAVKTEYTD